MQKMTKWIDVLYWASEDVTKPFSYVIVLIIMILCLSVDSLQE